ncbi:MAG: efflux RND transporter permease subunit, partial [Planctomycetota bacterium]
FESGLNPMDAAIQGLGGVIGGVSSSFVTTICVLGPLGFISGNIGQVLRVIPIVLILVLVISLVEAFCILPSHLAHSFRERTGKSNRSRQAVDAVLSFVRDSFCNSLVMRALRWRYLVLGVSVALLIVSISLVVGGVIRFAPFPNLEGDSVVARVLLPAGTKQAKTEEIVATTLQNLELTNQQLSSSETEGVSLVKNTTVEFGVNTEAYESGAHVATINVELLSVQSRNTRLDDFARTWSDAVGQPADVSWVSIGADAFGPAGQPIEVRIQGQDLNQLRAAALETKSWFEQFEGTRNLTIDLRLGKPELEFQVEEGATGMGLTANTIGQQMRAAVFGFEVGDLASETTNSTQAPPKIRVRMKQEPNPSLQDLDLFPISLPNGSLVSLEAVSNKRKVRGWSRIAHVNGLPTVTVRGDVDSRVISGARLVSLFRSQQAEKISENFPGTRFAFGGETQESQQTATSMAKGALLGMLGVFALLSLQFRNYFEPLIVMIAIPLSLIGVIAGHFWLGVDLSTPSMLGLISLAGIVVNDSILLVLFLKENRREFSELKFAATEAVRQRFRAILLTSLTTVAGLVPLIFETSLQAQVLIPIAISIAFGIMASTILILVVIPCSYVVLNDLGLSD